VSEAQANTAALESAKAFRAELVEKGILSEPKPRDPKFTSEVPGVKWRKNRQKWHVEITPKGGKKKIHGGLFTEKAAAEAKALEIVEKAGLQRQVKPVANLSELPVFQPKVPYPGVTWEQKSQQWHAQCRVAGANRHFTVKPKDHSEAELERSFQVAVAWRRKQEKENQKEKEKEINAVKSKVKPGRTIPSRPDGNAYGDELLGPNGGGISEAQADAAALEAAKAFRAELVEKGILSEPKPRDPNFTSEVLGVRWQKNQQKWRVEITPKGGKKKIHGGVFTEKAAAEAKALELVEKAGLQRQVKPVATLSELPVFHPKVPYPGVTWEQRSQQWHAQCQVAGANRHFRVKPKDHSEAELERSFQVAVAWRRKQEKENQKEKEKESKAVKSKVKPGRKQRK
ncbi:unnamed protein product, partial [Cladocopium goreaui]